MTSSCYSCGMPLAGTMARGNFCECCADEKGNLYSREQVQQGIAQWLQGFAPEGEGADYMKRAEYYMKAMPAWSDG